MTWHTFLNWAGGIASAGTWFALHSLGSTVATQVLFTVIVFCLFGMAWEATAPEEDA